MINIPQVLLLIYQIGWKQYLLSMLPAICFTAGIIILAAAITSYEENKKH